MLERPLKIYTDGSSCPQTTKEAGWGFVLFTDTEYKDAMIFCGYLAAPSTNNIGELLALTNSIRFIQKMGKRNVRIVSDSQYAIGLFERNTGSNTRPRLPPKNQNMCMDLWQAMNSTQARIDLKWVKGHAGHAGNELADAAAKWGKLQDNTFSGIGSLQLKYGVNIKVAKYFQHPDDFITFLKQRGVNIDG